MLPALPASQEESNEFGGTFVCNGIERIIRMLVQVRAGSAAGRVEPCWLAERLA